ncbi:MULTISPECIES: NERD domain-containing protein [Caballeronia]|uniref:NERD domain-containing protein n=1 Tax=Caballeronia TaxID=1827195 RepID=UPI0038572F05
MDKLRGLPDHWHAFTNLDLALPGRGMREIDLVIVTEDRLLLVDLKDWLGPISSRHGNWFNGERDHGRSLEQELGVRLIHRSTRASGLTPDALHTLRTGRSSGGKSII